MNQVSPALRGRNPDVLTCIANLSNDEVFAPPTLVNAILDSLEIAWAEDHDGANIWSDRDVTFLDPFTKSGVFLREVTSRLTRGLATAIPDTAERVDHILTKQVFGIAITQLTSLIARRSLYCSKYANGPHSIAKSFTAPDGNIWFDRTEHTWVAGRCSYCGANRSEYARGAEMETHAYAFLHTADVRKSTTEMFGAHVQFDVVIGNPPYQLTDESKASSTRVASAGPIYDLFVEQAKRLQPRYLAMVIPSRWMAGGRGLEDFRATMLGDDKIRVLVDYPDSTDVFGQGVRISGGVCYFLRDKSHNGGTQVTTVRGPRTSGPLERKLSEYDVFVRDVESVEILRKVRGPEEITVDTMFSTGFGFDTNFKSYREQKKPGDVRIQVNVGGMGHKRAVRYIDKAQVRRSTDLIDRWKLFVPSAAGYGAEQIPDRVLGQPIVAGPGEVCTQTYRVIGPFDTEAEARSFETYYRCKFFRFLVSLRKITQHASPSVYSWVPKQSWQHDWTDSMLAEIYGLTQEEMELIESVIRPLPAAEGKDKA